MGKGKKKRADADLSPAKLVHDIEDAEEALKIKNRERPAVTRSL